MASYRVDSVEGRFLEGDTAAIAEVSRWVAGVLAAPTFWALRRQRTDLHQEVLGRLVESLRRGRFDASREFKGYVQGVARFTAYKAVDRDVRDVETPESDTAATDADVPADSGTESRLLAAQLARQALEIASDDCRALIREYFLEEQRYREIAEDRGVPVGTIKSRLFRCLESIQRALRAPAGPR
ncbi:MAG: sigma-70 family RNA polymerase sigma factor [Acidobacteriota bacterium]|nr:sigma-70 family RNA polymerase sigma factor [Acidobacteriota bacterium]